VKIPGLTPGFYVLVPNYLRRKTPNFDEVLLLKVRYLYALILLVLFYLHQNKPYDKKIS
jgi:hypothetical protein